MEPLIKVHDLAFVRYRTTDLDVMEKFLTDFGMVVSDRTANALYLRGAGPNHHLYITELASERGCTGIAFQAATEDDLHILATAEGVSQVEDIDEPGGGKRVRLIDPTGYQIEVVHGIEPVAEIPVREALALNTDRQRTREGAVQRPEQGPAHIRRLGHVVLRVRDYHQCREFYSRHFGMMVSDEVFDGGPENVVVGFLKCDRGSDYTDHHTLGLAARPGAIGIDHSAYEVIDMDDVVLGGNYLASKDYYRSWGVGRHYMGSQIFDYWRDPFGFKVEHWTDGDLVNAQTQPTREQVAPTGPGALSQWGLMAEDHTKIYPGCTSIGPLSPPKQQKATG